MDHETLQALIGVYRARASADLLSIILDEAQGTEARAAMLELLHSLSGGALAGDKLAATRRKACRFSLEAEDYVLAERLSRAQDRPEDKALRARALYALGRGQEALVLYRQATAEDPGVRDRDIERSLGIRAGSISTAAPEVAKIIPITNFSARHDNKLAQERRDGQADAVIEALEEHAVGFGDVAGLDDIKAEIRRRIILPFLKPSLFERFGQKPGGNILIYGPPGCGKTLIARATAMESDARFLHVCPEDILDKYAGEAEKRLRGYFDEARSSTPVILFFDDFEVLGGLRREREGDAALALIAAFASELDGQQRGNGGILVMAASNAPFALDPAFFRSGRFQGVFFAPPPDLEARRKILKAAFARLPGAERLPFDRLARRTSGFSGADLTALADWASQAALSKTLAGAKDTTITMALVEEGMRSFNPSAAAWIRDARAKLRRGAAPAGRFAALDRA